jgi:hypothetical protein
MKTITIKLKDEHLNMLEAMELIEAPINIEPFERDILFREMILDLDYHLREAAKREKSMLESSHILYHTIGINYLTALEEINSKTKIID